MIEIKRYFRPDRGFENVEQLNGYIFSPEAQAHTFIISQLVLVDGVETPAEFQSTATVSCRFLKHNQVTELVEGSIESGKAVVTLPAECYAVPGRFTMTVLLTKDSSVTCIYAATGSVLDADSENVNVSQNTVRDVDEKIAEINSASATAQAAVSQVQTAVAGVPAVIASIPQDYTALSNSVGDLKSAVNNIGTVSIDGFPLTIGHMANTGKWGQLSAGSYQHFVYPVSSGDIIQFECTVKNTAVGFVTGYSLPLTSSTDVLYSSATGFNARIDITKDTPYTWTVPSDAKYLIVEKIYGSDDVGISVFTVNGYNHVLPLDSQIASFSANGSTNTNAFKLAYNSTDTWQSGELDANGELQQSDVYITSDFMPLMARTLHLILPTDGSVTARPYFYSSNNESSFGVRGTVTTATKDVTNGTYAYCRVMAKYTDGRNADDALKTAVLLLWDKPSMFRGKISLLGYTAFTQCTEEGYYTFSANELPQLTDKPDGLTTGGNVYVYRWFGGAGYYRQIIASDFSRYEQYASNAFKKTYPLDYETEPYNLTWEDGAINNTTGEDANSTSSLSHRIRTDGYTPFVDGVIIHIPDGMEMYLVEYHSDKTIYYKPLTLQTADFIAYPTEAGSYFRLFGGYSESGVETPVSAAKLFDVRKQITPEDAPTWYAFGDSITQGYYSANWGSIAGRTYKNYPAYGALNKKWKLVNYGVGGSGYLKVSDEWNSNAKQQIDAVDFTNCDICTLAFGVNDWHYNQEIGTVNDSKDLGTTMASNMKYCIEKILTDNPLCRLNIMLPMNCAAYGGDFSTDWGLGTSLTTSGTLQHVIDVIKAVAEMYHLPIIDQSKTGIANRYNILSVLPDGIHPSTATMKPYGERIANQII